MNSIPASALTILLVDDSADDVFFFRRAVGKVTPSATIYVAVDGLEAIHFFSRQGKFADTEAFSRPDVVFLDLKLPHFNGFEVLEWLRSRGQANLPPIVVLTSSDQPEDQERAKSLGATDYWIKPAAREQLHELFQTFRPLPETRTTPARAAV